MSKVLITDNPDSISYKSKMKSRVIMTREELRIEGIDGIEDIILDGDDVEIFAGADKKCKMRYCEFGIDWSSVDSINQCFNGAKTFVPERKIIDGAMYETDASMGGAFPNPAQPNCGNPDFTSQLLKLDEILKGKKIVGSTLAEIAKQMIDLFKEHKIFEFDVISGNYRTIFSNSLLDGFTARDKFSLFFCDKVALKKVTTKYSETGEQIVRYEELSRNKLELLWGAISSSCQFNSRVAFYDSLPEWDKKPRIKNFMRDFMGCDANPNFFLLLETAIVAKFSPRNDYVPFFFDIVSPSKGIGKSYLCKRLAGEKYCGFPQWGGRPSDYFVDIYDGGWVINVDDESTLVDPAGKGGYGKLSYDAFKALVTAPKDKFSRKYLQPEEHDRSWILIRTSNDVHTVFSAGERRQIIFECKLEPNECLIKDLPDSYFVQMLSEAKDYYEKNGVYKLTESDWAEIHEKNAELVNIETPKAMAIADFVKEAHKDDSLVTYSVTKKWGKLPLVTYNTFMKWLQSKNLLSLKISSREFTSIAENLGASGGYGVDGFFGVKSRIDVKSGGKHTVIRLVPFDGESDDDEFEDGDDLENVPF